MKRKLTISLVGLVAVLGVCLINAATVQAAAPYDYDSCISSSGGRGSISSVGWACANTYWDIAGNNVCSLWIGGSNSTSTTIEVNQAYGDVVVYVYGMCTREEAPVMDVETRGDNGSIGKINPFWRGEWGDPTYTPVKLNVSNFIKGLSPSATSKGDTYSRTINLKRCYAYYGNGVYWRFGNDDECSDQNVDITVVVKNKFAGRASVSGGGASRTTGFVSNNKTADDLSIDCLGSECTAKFVLELKSEIGNGSTNYTIYRDDTVKKTGSSSPGSGSKIAEYTETMHPGDRICYSIKFGVTAASGANATAKTCVVATANMDSSLDIKVRDQASGARYTNWQSDFVYAKPSDAIELWGTYNPNAQAAYTMKTASTRIVNDNAVYVNNGKTIGKTFDDNRVMKWDNVFTIYINDNFYENIVGEIGSGALYGNEKSPYVYTVGAGDAGKKLGAKARTNYDANARKRITPAAVSIVNENGSSVAKVNVSEKSSNEVYVYVPYNFNNNVDIITEDIELYTGGSKNIEYNLHVGEKQNDETNGFYATKVKNTRWSVSVKYNDEEYIEVAAGSGDLEPGDNKKNDSIGLRGDLAAGTNVCVRVELSPAYSGGDKNLDSSKFSGVAVAEKCFAVAKKPNFQVWGGSVYSNGNINLGDYVIKKDLAGYTGSYMFGSWTELSLQSNGIVKGFASGAGLGYTKDSNDNIFPSPYGDNSRAGSADSPGGALVSDDLCRINTLSFRNDGCRVGSIGGANIVIDDNRERMAEELEKIGDKEVLAEGLGLSCENECVLDGGTLRSGTKVVIGKDNDLIIAGDIKYGDLSGDNLPKLFVYAKNITIDCDVSRIDAVLIADGYVDTCKTIDDNGYANKYNSPNNSNQLKINGSIIADELVLNRTYGAGIGNYTIVPAEIINYDPTLYVWGVGRSEEISKGRYISEFSREMSPRY